MPIRMLGQAEIGNGTVRAINAYHCAEYFYPSDLASFELRDKRVRDVGEGVVETVIFYDPALDITYNIWSRQQGFADKLCSLVKSATESVASQSPSFAKRGSVFSWEQDYREYYSQHYPYDGGIGIPQ